MILKFVSDPTYETNDCVHARYICNLLYNLNFTSYFTVQVQELLSDLHLNIWKQSTILLRSQMLSASRLSSSR